MKKRGNQVIAGCMALILGLMPVISPVTAAKSEAEEVVVSDHVLHNPVIEAEKGHVVWDCVYFGNYWQSQYITQPGNRPETGEDDVEHTDEDGTKYIVRADMKCYKSEPIKWRVLSVNEDGTDAFLISDQNLDVKSFYFGESEGVAWENITWENSDIRAWLNDDFMKTAFTEEEQEAINETEIDNLKNPYASEEEALEDGNDTTDKVYLPSLNEITSREYGFVPELKESDTRLVLNTDFAVGGNGGNNGQYMLRTLGVAAPYVSHVTSYGDIPTWQLFSHGKGEECTIRPVLHLDLTKTDLWTYAGQVKQDKTEIAPDATPVVPTPTPTVLPGVTMAPGQIYPKNPVVYAEDLKKNTWDCIYFGKYYGSKFTPSVLSEAGEHEVGEHGDTMKVDENGNPYIVRHQEGYFYYEPIKWRVLSINEDGTDAFLLSDKVLDVYQYYNEADVEITWEKSDVRYWLGTDFFELAFSETEKDAILETEVKTPDNKWSGEPGGNDTKDKVYLLSIEEALEPAYGFSSDENEVETRKITPSDYSLAEQSLDRGDPSVYWLRSSGPKIGVPAVACNWGDGVIPTETSVGSRKSTEGTGVRPVIHVDLSNTDLWTYAGQVTPKGIVAASTDDEKSDPTPTPELTKEPDATVTPPPSTTSQPETKKLGKPAIKTLKNKSGKKVALKLSKKVPGVTGYQVAYATKSSMKGQKTKTFKGTSITIKGLKKKKTYYFRVRAYTKQNGKTVYGDWSKKKQVKVKK